MYKINAISNFNYKLIKVTEITELEKHPVMSNDQKIYFWKYFFKIFFCLIIFKKRNCTYNRDEMIFFKVTKIKLKALNYFRKMINHF